MVLLSDGSKGQALPTRSQDMPTQTIGHSPTGRNYALPLDDCQECRSQDGSRPLAPSNPEARLLLIV
jgi:hypothetical protein